MVIYSIFFLPKKENIAQKNAPMQVAHPITNQVNGIIGKWQDPILSTDALSAENPQKGS